MIDAERAYNECDYEWGDRVMLDYENAIMHLNRKIQEPLKFMYKTHAFRCLVQDANGMIFPVDANLLRRV